MFDDQHDEALARELLGILNEDFPELPDDLPDRTIRKIEAEMTSRDLLDLTTLVFLTSFCAPLLDLFAAFFGDDSRSHDSSGHRGSPRDRSRDSAADSVSSSYYSHADRVTSDEDHLSDLLSDETNRDSHDE